MIDEPQADPGSFAPGVAQGSGPSSEIAQGPTGHGAKRLRNFVIVIVVIVVCVLTFAASRYQPLTLSPSWRSSILPNSAGEVRDSLQVTLANTGPLGVSIEQLQPKVFADPPVVTKPLMPCFQFVGHRRDCRQNARGLVTGDRFHAFALSGSASMPLAWQFSFSCRPLPGGDYTSGPVEVRVTYRFLFFSHSVPLVVPNESTSDGTACVS